jgi:hypothetical protein
LLELHGQSLAQRVVKYRIASLVLEVGEDDVVLCRSGSAYGEEEGNLRPKASAQLPQQRPW